MLAIARKDGLFDYKILLQNISLQIHKKIIYDHFGPINFNMSNMTMVILTNGAMDQLIGLISTKLKSFIFGIILDNNI
jgi:hypothetical protein